MLRSFRANNFRLLVNFRFEPAPGTNVVLGANASGKTTLFLALALLRDLARSPIATAGGAMIPAWTIPNYYTNDRHVQLECDADVPVDGVPRRFRYSLTLEFPSSAEQYSITPGMWPRVHEERLLIDAESASPTILLHNDGRESWMLRDDRAPISSDPATSHVKTRSPTDSTMLQKLWALDTNRLAITFRQYLTLWRFYDIDVSALRRQGERDTDDVLSIDAGNLRSALFSLKVANERVYRQVLRDTQQVDPTIDILNFQRIAPDRVMMVAEDDGGHKTPSEAISSGTLRYLALALAIRSASATPSVISPFVFIEEPENGLFPNLLRGIYELASSLQVQTVFSTHSPYLIDAFDRVPGGVHVFRRRGPVVSVSKPEPDAMKKRLQEFSLGEQFFRGLLEE
jgi:predicted ATPase